MTGVRAAVEALLAELSSGGSSAERGGRHVSISYIVATRHQVASVIVSVPVDLAQALEGVRGGDRRTVALQPEVRFWQENARDRLGKAIGVNEEVQTGDESFDTQVYVDSSAPTDDVQSVLANRTTREHLQELVKLGRVTLGAGRLTVVVIWKGHFTREEFEDAAAHLVGAAGGLPRFATVGEVQKPKVLVPLFGFIAGAAVFVAATSIGSSYEPLQAHDCRTAVGLGILGWVAFLFVLSRFVRGRSDSFRMLALYAFITAFVLPTGIAMLLFAANAAYDVSQPVEHPTTVARTWYTTGKHNSRTYHLAVDMPGRVNLPVPSHVAREAYEGESITVTVGKGRFGWPWMKRYELGPRIEAPLLR